MSSTTHRRTASGRTEALGAVVAAAVIGGAAYTKTIGWDGGYTGQYVVTNATDETQSDWTLEFDLPAGT